MSRKQNVLIISHDKVGPSMAGPGIRYHNIAAYLSDFHNVTLATFNPEYLANLKNVPYQFTDIKTYDFKPAFDRFDVIIALWLSEEMIAYAKEKGKLLIFDLYAPVPVENLVGQVFSHKKLQPEDDYNYLVSIENYKNFLASGDFFLASNAVQKDFWTGYGFATGKIYPSAYKDFPLYDRIGVCPMGIDLNELQDRDNHDPIREKFPQIKKSDFVMVWTGGIWDWFDAITPIKAMSSLKKEGITNVKLVFLGTRHPNKDVPEMGETEKAFLLAEKLGLTNNSVFFFEGWIEYNKRVDYLLASDAAVYAHKPSIESRFSHRTRVLDHILTGLPTIATEGDYFADLIAEKQLGYAVSVHNEDAIVDAVKKLQKKSNYSEIRNNITSLQANFTWEVTLAPLMNFLSENHKPRKVSSLKPISSTKSTKSLVTKTKRFIPRSVKERAKRQIAKMQKHTR